ncbi:PqqD family protein [Plebeiibacterium marinum]|uniref:PqqD family protein n=1 Tax=Plebeiibacterium marinum TaxID=2992111 RepID=A0AAE3MAV1_9BACT|nr:PqqD family protein [Plebeiobacterium marinum]MCW3804027.1 PqqD family protein [Plebeiobacterium marinum]
MKVSNNISISKSGFVFDSKTGESYSLNGIAKEIMELLVEGRSEEEIIEYITTKYDVSPELFARHLDDYIQMLSHFNLTENE